MAVDFTKPVTSDLRAAVLQYIRDYMAGQAKMFDGETLTSTPTNAIRYSSANSQFEKWNGSSWAALTLGFLPLAGGTLSGALTGAAAEFSSLTIGGQAVWHAGNLTPGNYLPLAGGTLTGTLNTRDVLPDANNTRALGSNSFRFAAVHATAFTEAGTTLASKYAPISHSHSYLPLSGGTLTGALAGTDANFSASLSVGGVAVSLVGHTHAAYLPLAGGTLSGLLTTAAAGIDIANADTTLTREAAGIVAVEGKALGYLDIPQASSTPERGKILPVTSGLTLNTDTADRCYGIYNNSAADITLTQGAGLTLRKNGTTTTGNLTLSKYGMCTVWYRTASEAIVSGALA